MLEAHTREAPRGNEWAVSRRVEHEGHETGGRQDKANERTVRQRRSRTVTGGTKERRVVRKIRFSGAEWAVVEERARSCGRAPARYVREVALGAVPKMSRTRANAPIIRELGALAAAVQRVRGVVSGPDSGADRGAVPEPSSGATSPGSDVGAELEAVVSGLLTLVRRLA